MTLLEEISLYEKLWDSNYLTEATEATDSIPGSILNQVVGDAQFSKQKAVPVLQDNGKKSKEVPCLGRDNGCSDTFTGAKPYSKHIVACDAARPHLTHKAVVKNKKHDHNMDSLANITAGNLITYIETHDTCELCGTVLELSERRPDHEHSDKGSRVNGKGEGRFRGVLCDRCNTALGKLEDLLMDSELLKEYSPAGKMRRIYNYMRKADLDFNNE